MNNTTLLDESKPRTDMNFRQTAPQIDVSREFAAARYYPDRPFLTYPGWQKIACNWNCPDPIPIFHQKRSLERRVHRHGSGVIRQIFEFERTKTMRRSVTLFTLLAVCSVLALAESWQGRLVEATCYPKHKRPAPGQPPSSTTRCPHSGAT